MKPLTPLLVLTLLYSAGLIILALRGVAPSQLLETLWAISFPLLAVYWIRGDLKARGDREPFFEFEAFIFFGSLVVVPYYLFRTRGTAGLAGAFGFWMLALFPFTVAKTILTLHRL
ncbi:MAG TPA: hypothetical protein VGD60_07890 [Candidatus Acidoferrales bacterium]